MGYFNMTASSITESSRTIDQLVNLTTFRQTFRGLGRIKWEVNRLLSVPIAVVTWPVLLILLRRIHGDNRVKWATAIELSPWVFLSAACTLCYAALLTTLHLLAGPHWSIDVGCAALLASLLARLVASTLGEYDLPGQLRRSLMRPYLQFILTAAADYLSLLLAGVLVEQLRTGNEISKEVILRQIKGLSAFTHVIAAIRSTPLAPLTLLLTVTGIAYFAMIGKLILQYRQFARRPEDHAYIISALAAIGKLQRARHWFDKQDSNTRSHSSMFRPRVWILLEAGEYDKAYELVDAWQAMAGDRSLFYATKSVDSVLNQLIGMSKTFGLHGSELRNVIAFAVKRGVSDACLTLHLPSAVDDMEIGSLVGEVDLNISKERYPMAILVVIWMTAESFAMQDAALEQLASVASSSKTDRLVQLYYLIMISLAGEHQPIDMVENLLSELTDVSDLPGWFRADFSSGLLALSFNSRLEEVNMKTRILQCRATLLEGADSDEMDMLESMGSAARMINLWQ